MLNLLPLLPFLASAQAFFILSQPVLLTTRLDPIVDPGTVSGHVHTIAGGSNFDKYMTQDSALSSTCTTAPVTVDKSNYWIPQLYYYNPKTSGYQAIPVAYVNTYYLPRKGKNDTVRAFPDGLRMISGDPFRRDFDPKDVNDQAVSYVCLDYAGGHQGDPAWDQRNNFFQHNCPDGLRAQVNFPTCWNGKDLDSPDHRSHMAWPTNGNNNGGGDCPASHPVKVVQLFYEFIFEVQKFPFNAPGTPTWVFANGDARGYGLHADFINGWPKLVNGTNVLQRAIDECVGADGNGVAGNLEACPPFAGLINKASAQGCRPQNPLVNEDIGYGHEIPFLPGDNPLWRGNVEKPSDPNYTEPDTEYSDPRSVVPANWSYVGCISEPASGRALTAFSMSVITMTRAVCAAECGKRGYPLSGTEYGRECYCDYAMQNGASNTTLLPAERCNVPCAANGYENCGGSRTLSLYVNPTLFPSPVDTVSPANPASPAGVDGWFKKQSNCVAEPAGRRALTGFNTANGQMTSVACMTLCQARGFAFAGTQWSSECYCGSSIDSGAKEASSADCDRPCAGKPDEMCGGAQRLSMYYFNSTAPVKSTLPQDWVTNGCWYGPAANGRAFTGPLVSNTTMTNDVCMLECQSKGYVLAGVEYGRECRCAQEFAPGSVQAPASDCGMVCAGNPSQLCGAGNRMTTFKFTGKFAAPVVVAPVLPQDWTSLGCYNGQINGARAFTAAYVSNTSMTNEVCMLECQSRGFPLAGVEYGRECRCAQELPAGAAQVAAADCSMPCAGNSTQICGAGNRMSTFKYIGKFAAPVVVAPVLPQDWAVNGCWNGQAASGRAFTGAYVSNTSMTNEICMLECQSKGFVLAGVEYGRECRCANDFAAGSSQVAAADCSMPCAGNAAQICGAGNRMTTFKYTGKVAAPVGAPTPNNTDVKVSGWTHSGCFTEGSGGRALTRYNFASKDMTIPICLAACQERGWKFGGVEYGQECYCGDAIANNAKAATDGCTMVCPGSQMTLCGGPNRLNIFETSTPAPTTTTPAPAATSISAWTYRGCYTEGSGIRAVPSGGYKSLGDMDRAKCLALAEQAGHSWAALVYGRECFTGPALNDKSVLTAESECGFTCVGSKTGEKCGGNNRASVLEWTGRPVVVAGPSTYIGCFTDRSNRQLNGTAVFGDNKNMSNGFCVDYCAKRGFAMSGTSYGAECMCGNYINRSDNITTSNPSSCGMACAAAPQEKCGAAWQVSVSLTGLGSPIYYDQAVKRDLRGSRVARKARRAGGQ